MAAVQPARNGNTQEEEQELAFGQVWKDAAKAPTRPSIGDGQDGGRRKSSVAFHTSDAEETIRRESVSQVPRASLSQKRMASPPPPSNYHRGVSFDTFDNKEASTESFTLMYKHRDYAHSARSRTFLCGTDAKDYSEYALEWMIDELVDDGDEIVCLRVIEKEDKIDIKPNLKYREEAQKLLASVIHKNQTEEKEISIVMELAVGKVQEIFQQMVGTTIADVGLTDSPRYNCTNPLLWSWEHGVATLVVCKVYFQDRCQNTAYSILLFQSSLSDLPRND